MKTKGKSPTQRKILTLDERISVLRMYEILPNYSQLADLFGVSVTAIRNTLFNRDRIMKYYGYRANAKSIEEVDIRIPRVELKLNRMDNKLNVLTEENNNIDLLGECVHEALKRKRSIITMELITTTALEFQDIMNLHNFKINKRWLNRFRYKYKITFLNQEKPQKYVPPADVDLHEILQYCKQKLLRMNSEDGEVIDSRSNHVISNSLNPLQQCNEESYKELSTLSAEPSVSKHSTINSYSDVLKALKPVEEFAALSANYQALVLISRLEKHIRKK